MCACSLWSLTSLTRRTKLTRSKLSLKMQNLINHLFQVFLDIFTLLTSLMLQINVFFLSFCHIESSTLKKLLHLCVFISMESLQDLLLPVSHRKYPWPSASVFSMLHTTLRLIVLEGSSCETRKVSFLCSHVLAP